MRIGLSCLTLAFGTGLVVNASLPVGGGQVGMGFDSAGGTPILLVYGAGVVGLLLVVWGLIWESHRYRAEQRRLVTKKVVVVETRGLRDTSGTPLIEAIPSNLEGPRDNVLVDIRQRVKDGEIVAPEAALEDLISLPSNLRMRSNGLDRRDSTLVYGGLAPVPFTFLAGVLIDDEGAVVILDWDRHAEAWRRLDESDDGNRFSSSGLDSLQAGTPEVALAVSVSYRVNTDDVRAKVGRIPIATLSLEGGSHR